MLSERLLHCFPLLPHYKIFDSGNSGVVLKVLVKKKSLGIHFLKRGALTKQGTKLMAILGIGTLPQNSMDTHIAPF